jgi:hydroxyacylglutathione hydrolase
MGVFTGDFVFVGDLGRPDLLESAAGFQGKADPFAHRLYTTVQKFMQWPDYLQIWPAHGAGSACGKALGAVPSTTVGYEKMFNASILAAKSEQGFVDFILDAQPEPPLYFARMKRDNKIGPKVLGGVPQLKRLSIDELKAIDGTKAAIVDTRPWAAFKAGHVPGALHLPLNNSFNTDGGSLIGEHEPIVVIADGSRVDEAVRDLIRVGFDNFAGGFDPSEIDAYRAAGGTLVGAIEKSVGEARVMLDAAKPFVLDVRRAAEFKEGHIEGATNIAHTRLLSRLAEVPKDRHILVNCRSGARSARACSLLLKHGYQCTNLAGGMLAWEQGRELARR